MNLQRLRYFQAAAEFGSLRKAADALQLSQPALSRQIQVLEHELKAALFVRADKRVSLTEAGRLLAERAPAILGEVQDVQRRIEAMARQRRTHATVGAIQSTCTYLLPLAIRAFQTRFPSIQIAVQGSRSDDIIARVGRRTLDVGIVAAPVLDPRLVAIPLARDPFMLVAPPGHRLAGAGPVAVEDIASEPLVTFPRGFLIRETIETAFAAVGRDLDVAVELESIEAIKELVRQRAGISLLPRSTMIGTPATRELSAVRLRGDAISREIVAVHPAGEPVAPPLRFLREAIGAVLLREDLDAAIMA